MCALIRRWVCVEKRFGVELGSGGEAQLAHIVLHICQRNAENFRHSLSVVGMVIFCVVKLKYGYYKSSMYVTLCLSLAYCASLVSDH